MTDNIFTKIHTDRDGNETPIVSMGTDHLVRMVNYIFRRGLQDRLQQIRNIGMSGFAPDGMPDRQRRSLGLRKLTDAAAQEIQNRIDEYEAQALESAMHEFWPYVVVGVMRDDTREGVIKILQDAFGINGRIELPGLMRISLGGLFELEPGQMEEYGELDDLDAALEQHSKDKDDERPF